MSMDKLIEQAPYLAAIVIVVFAFLKAQSLRDSAFLQAQSDRDKIYLQAQVDRDKIYLEAQSTFTSTIVSLTTQVGQMENILIRHDATMAQKANNIERAIKTKPRS